MYNLFRKFIEMPNKAKDEVGIFMTEFTPEAQAFIRELSAEDETVMRVVSKHKGKDTDGSSARKSKRVVCPDCGQGRHVRVSTALYYSTLDTPPSCRSCAGQKRSTNHSNLAKTLKPADSLCKECGKKRDNQGKKGLCRSCLGKEAAEVKHGATA